MRRSVSFAAAIAFATVILAGSPAIGSAMPSAAPAMPGYRADGEAHRLIALSLKGGRHHGARRRYALPRRHHFGPWRAGTRPFPRRIGSSYAYPIAGPIGPTPLQGMPGPQVYTPPTMLPTPQYYTTPGSMQYCATRFRSYDATTNTRRDSHGIARPCP
jgi:hypothetical protein